VCLCLCLKRGMSIQLDHGCLQACSQSTLKRFSLEETEVLCGLEALRYQGKARLGAERQAEQDHLLPQEK